MASDPVLPPEQSAYPSQYAPYPPYAPYGPYPTYAPYPPEPTTNVLAIVGFITSFFVGLAGIICGHIALSQIRRTGEKGRGLALAATIIGYAQFAWVFVWIAVVSLIAMSSFVHSAAATVSDSSTTQSSDCASIDSAAQQLSTSLTSLEASDWRDAPATAKEKLLAEWSRFDEQPSRENQAMSDAIGIEDDDLNRLSTALVDYEAAAPGQGDAAAVTSAFANAQAGLRMLMSSCN
jgi:hypothetical protein